MSFKKCKVVMLPTNEKASITMSLMNILINGGSHPENNQYKNIHLYILSDEEIKEGDWFITNNVVHKCIGLHKVSGDVESNNGLCYDITKCKKIIATTDKSLTTNISRVLGVTRELPQPSQSFIEKFVEEYNKGNVITEVLVEYDMMYKDMTGEHKALMLVGTEYPKLKINPKDNTITIRKVKDSWSREEVIALITKFNWDADATNDIWKDKWIEENL